MQIQSLYGSWEKRGFVKAFVSRAVRIRECPLEELPLYSLKNMPVFLTFAFPSAVAGHKGMFIPADIVKPIYNGHIMIIIHGKIRIIWKKIKDFFFQGFFFATAKVASVTAMIFFHIIIHPAVLIYDFHIFITSSLSFHVFITNQLNDLLPVGLLVQLVARCTSIAEVKDSNPVQA